MSQFIYIKFNSRMQQNTIRPIPIPNLSIGLTKSIRSVENVQLDRDQNDVLIMNERNLHILCLREGLYQYPELNKKLYLHFKGFFKIQNLNTYINIKTLYLENNVIRKIENLQCLPQLENLFLQNNMIKEIQNLDSNKQLKIINLSSNNIFQINNISNLPELQTLTISDNYLKTFEDLEHLGQCSQTLTGIDLSGNKIESGIKFLDLIPQVKCLYLFGNPLVRDIVHYRRTVVGKLANLLYLDNRTIDSDERITSEAYINSGQKGYKQARQMVLKLKQQQKKQSKLQLMENIDFHRLNKISRFQINIQEYTAEIQSLNQQISRSTDSDQKDFYENRKIQLKIKIQETQDFIKNIKSRLQNKYIGPNKLQTNSLSLMKKQEGLFQKGSKSQMFVSPSFFEKSTEAGLSQYFKIQIKQSNEQQITISELHQPIYFGAIDGGVQINQINTQLSVYYQQSNSNSGARSQNINYIHEISTEQSIQIHSQNISEATTMTNQQSDTATYNGTVRTYYTNSTNLEELD